jgi:hypothetical protein
MPKLPVDAPREWVLKAFQRLGFELVWEGNHMAWQDHRLIKGFSLRLILRQSAISREDFLAVYEED